ncbi:uncharacterized protein PHACADRAFT_182510 [Phanerochaete carnosa HHB-10118-sp]|uniref:Uncharacterized protein n=1 Tax=Phanerochaete carnosa (strain HHB-10118-sp) TaxID=650164 RepID=K5WGA1_PHACS|nr:uncharacterized protein PHACADRAFT_182510 [Phanerochaete carnosa HHB-10118-sp]EKM58129.1 hypothetical protein PHACADRAFT_182510 [Phanerochaete carnosa HHB-10118-sp]
MDRRRRAAYIGYDVPAVLLEVAVLAVPHVKRAWRDGWDAGEEVLDGAEGVQEGAIARMIPVTVLEIGRGAEGGKDPRNGKHSMAELDDSAYDEEKNNREGEEEEIVHRDGGGTVVDCAAGRKGGS